MTGPEHFLEAERLIAVLDAWDSSDSEQQPIIAELIATAQVHATLALAAATAEQLERIDDALRNTVGGRS